ncbi:MAG: hypothetical protein HY508_15270 [Acidobacteria bacterium]|nr:hypothetical protein [Acidobacteriota bacterium]
MGIEAERLRVFPVAVLASPNPASAWALVTNASISRGFLSNTKSAFFERSRIACL